MHTIIVNIHNIPSKLITEHLLLLKEQMVKTQAAVPRADSRGKKHVKMIIDNLT